MTNQQKTQTNSASRVAHCYTVLDLFSGLGGFSLGLTRAGFRTVAFCEIEEYPRSILRKHWPDVPIFEDVRKLHATDLPEPIDVICGGFPCQPYSIAGKRQGAEDDRHLWPEMFRLVKEVKPSWVIGENVAHFANMGFDQAAIDLESEGYEVEAFIIPACAINAPHRRDRIWIIAANPGYLRRRGWTKPNKKEWSEVTNLGSVAANSEPEGLERLGLPGSTFEGEGQAKWAKQFAEGSVFRATEFGELTTHGWTAEPPLCGRDDGLSHRVARLKALGNAVVPQIPELIGRMILSV